MSVTKVSIALIFHHFYTNYRDCTYYELLLFSQISENSGGFQCIDDKTVVRLWISFWIAFGSAIGCIVLMVLVFLGRYIYKKRRNITETRTQIKKYGIDVRKHRIVGLDQLKEMRQIGLGTFGAVYRAKWRGDDVSQLC